MFPFPKLFALLFFVPRICPKSGLWLDFFKGEELANLSWSSMLGVITDDTGVAQDLVWRCNVMQDESEQYCLRKNGQRDEQMRVGTDAANLRT